jgi:Ca2+-transporting ATPase
MKDIEWHHLKADQIISRLQSNSQSGLSLDAVQQLRDQYGSNVLTATRGRSGMVCFLLQFHQPLIYILIVSGCVTALLREWVDSGVIFGVVLVNGIIGYIQEARAENALAALADTMVAEALVIRDSIKERIPSTELVPGDIVLLSAGDRVPADLRII